MPRRKTPSQTRARATRQKVLDAATTILTERGMTSITTRKIATLAGISIGSVYEYFPNKQAIIYDLYQSRLDKLIAILDSTFTQANMTSLPLSKLWESYLQKFRDQHMASAVDLELRNAVDSDSVLRQMTLEYEAYLTERDMEILRQFGAEWAPNRLKLLVEFMHGIHHLNLKLQKGRPSEERELAGRTTEYLYLQLAKYCGVKMV